MIDSSSAAVGKEWPATSYEVGREKIKPDLPAVPAFDIPPVNPDGSHSVKEMRVKGRKLLDQEVQVKGYVTWIYDCATAIRTPEMSDEDVKKIITEDPTRCSRPKFTIGDSADPQQRAKIVSILTYHILPGTVLAQDIGKSIDNGKDNKAMLMTVGGQTFTASKDGGNIVITDSAGNVAHITKADDQFSNGVVHHIDAVLTPPQPKAASTSK